MNKYRLFLWTEPMEEIVIECTEAELRGALPQITAMMQVEVTWEREYTLQKLGLA